MFFSRMRPLVITLYTLAIAACSGGGDGGGSSGSSSGSSTPPPPPATETIRIDDSAYRDFEAGDLLVFDVEADVQQYLFGSVSAEEVVDTTFEYELFNTDFVPNPGDPDAWANAEIFLIRTSTGEGESSSEYVYQTGALVYDVGTPEGFSVSYDGEEGFYGSIRYPELVAGTSVDQTSELRRRDDGFLLSRRISTFTVSSPEVIETPVGRIEAFPVTLDAEEEEYEPGSFTGTPILSATLSAQYTYHIHPKIGVISWTGNERYDDTPSSDDSFVEITLNKHLLRSVNFPIPNPTPDS